MSKFSAKELEYLTTANVLGRLATIDRDGQPHLVPLGWSYNPDSDTIDISGRDFANTKKFRNVKQNPRVTFLVDEVLPPWRPRAVMVAGVAQAIDPQDGRQALIRIEPKKIISWGL